MLILFDYYVQYSELRIYSLFCAFDSGKMMGRLAIMEIYVLTCVRAAADLRFSVGVRRVLVDRMKAIFDQK